MFRWAGSDEKNPAWERVGVRVPPAILSQVSAKTGANLGHLTFSIGGKQGVPFVLR
jgi:hypothetical protein